MKQKLNLTFDDRKRRHFSADFKKEKVREIESGRVKISEVCSQYQVTHAAVYRWIDKFGEVKKERGRIIVGTENDTRQFLELQKRISELERMVGQKQVEIERLKGKVPPDLPKGEELKDMR